jgi:hypothetical protein
MVAEKVETSLDPANEGLVGVLLQTEHSQGLVDQPHCAPKLPAGGSQNENVIHEADIEQPQLGSGLIECVEKECPDQRT